MGKPGSQHTGEETSESLRTLAAELESVAKALKIVAERMDRKGVKAVIVLGSRGARTAVTEKLRPFAIDADRKAARRGA